jgi:hypothetical protein
MKCRKYVLALNIVVRVQAQLTAAETLLEIVELVVYLFEVHMTVILVIYIYQTSVVETLNK